MARCRLEASVTVYVTQYVEKAEGARNAVKMHRPVATVATLCPAPD